MEAARSASSAEAGELVERLHTSPNGFAAVLGDRPRADPPRGLDPTANGWRRAWSSWATRSSAPTPTPPPWPSNNHLVLIEGHTDERGTKYNLALGERRAKTSMNYLVAQGVAASRITIISYGEDRALCTESGERCWSKNRRAHFLVKPR